MAFRVLLKDTLTGETVWYEDTVTSYENLWYVWTEGNYACDCNRRIFFEQAAGRFGGVLLEDNPCGRDRYRIQQAFWNGREEKDFVYEDADV